MHYLLSLALVFSLGPLVQIAVALWGSPVKTLRFPWSGLALGLALAIVWHLLDLGHVRSGAGSNDTLALAMSLGGLIIAVITGLTVTAAWRAIDESNRAAAAVSTLSKALDERLARTEFETLRAAAYIEAVQRHRELSNLNEFPDRVRLRTEIIPLFTSSDPTTIIERIREVEANPAIATEIGPLGRQLLQTLTTRSDVSDDQRITLHRTLTQLPA